MPTAQPTTHKHILTFESAVPAIQAAIKELQNALSDAGFPHTVESRVFKPKAARGHMSNHASRNQPSGPAGIPAGPGARGADPGA